MVGEAKTAIVAHQDIKEFIAQNVLLRILVNSANLAIACMVIAKTASKASGVFVTNVISAQIVQEAFHMSTSCHHYARILLRAGSHGGTGSDACKTMDRQASAWV